MTRPPVRNTKAKRRKAAVKVAAPRRPTTDRAIYLGILIIGFFFVLLASLFWELDYWAIFTIVYLAFIAYLVNFYTFQVYRGSRLANWQQALARVPLRFVGYGTKGGKPLEAAHDHSETLRALTLCVVVSLAILGAMTLATWRLMA